MQFILPACRHGRAPLPTQPHVRIVERPPCLLAVETFTGRLGMEHFQARGQALEARLQADGHELEPGAPHEFFRYNPPWTLGWLRTNEVAVHLRRAAMSGPRSAL